MAYNYLQGSIVSIEYYILKCLLRLIESITSIVSTCCPVLQYKVIILINVDFIVNFTIVSGINLLINFSALQH